MEPTFVVYIGSDVGFADLQNLKQVPLTIGCLLNPNNYMSL